MTREDLLALRQLLLLGNPPYTVDPVMGTRLRSAGVVGLEERRALSDHDANAAGIRLVMEAQLALVEHILERTRKS